MHIHAANGIRLVLLTCIFLFAGGNGLVSLSAQVKVKAVSRPERQDDMTLENEHLAFRLYSYTTQKIEKNSYGYDIFNKRTNDLVLDQLYSLQCDGQMWATHSRLRKMGQRDLADDLYNAFCYHVDHGVGMDCYKVGHTLGAGACAILTNINKVKGKKSFAGAAFHHIDCFEKAEIVESDDSHAVVKLVFPKREVNGDSIVEERILTLCAGEKMVKSVVTYHGQTKPLDVCAGIVVHKENADGYVIDEKNRLIAVEDFGDPEIYAKKYRAKQDPDKGKTYIGVYVPDKKAKCFFLQDEKTPGGVGHVVSAVTLRPGQSFTYYFGNAWNRNPNVGIGNMEQWTAFLQSFINVIP